MKVSGWAQHLREKRFTVLVGDAFRRVSSTNIGGRVDVTRIDLFIYLVNIMRVGCWVNDSDESCTEEHYNI